MNGTITLSLKNIALVVGMLFVVAGFYVKYNNANGISGYKGQVDPGLNQLQDKPRNEEALQIELSDYVNAEGQQILLVTITNTSKDTIAVPEELRYSRFILFDVVLKDHLNGEYIGPRGSHPEIIELDLVPLRPMDSRTVHRKVVDETNFPKTYEFWHIRAWLVVPVVESTLPGMKTWSGAISSDWIHFAPDLFQPKDSG